MSIVLVPGCNTDTSRVVKISLDNGGTSKKKCTTQQPVKRLIIITLLRPSRNIDVISLITYDPFKKA